MKQTLLKRLVCVIWTITLAGLWVQAGDSYYYYVKLISCDSAKGLVYGEGADKYSAAPEEITPEYADSCDVKWSTSSEPTWVWAFAQAADGYLFNGWNTSLEGALETNSTSPVELDSGGGDIPTYNLNPSKTYYALFGKVGSYVSPECETMGTVTISNPSSDPGEEVVMTATPKADNFSFVEWVKDGVSVSLKNPYSVTTTENPQAFYAKFKEQTEMAYNFDKDGEWRVYYHPTRDAKIPTAATGAYSVFMQHASTVNLSEGDYYYMLPVDSLMAGVTYLIHGAGNGTIEYVASENNFTSASPLLYADKEISDGSSSRYFVFDSETQLFKRWNFENGFIPKGSAFIKNFLIPDELYCLGEISPSLIYDIESYTRYDLLTDITETITEPTQVTLSFVQSTGYYQMDQFFGYEVNNHDGNWNFWPGSLTDLYFGEEVKIEDSFTLPHLIWNEETDGFNKFLAIYRQDTYSDEEIIEGEYSEDSDYESEEENSIWDTYICIKPGIDGKSYEMTPFYSYLYLIPQYDEDLYEGLTPYDVMESYHYISDIVISPAGSGIKSVVAEGGAKAFRIENGRIVLCQEMTAQVYSISGAKVFDGVASTIDSLSHGIYILRLGSASYKIAL